MYKNSEGYPDQVQGEALNGVRREEKQRALERKYGYSRGQKIVVEAKVREDQGSRRMIAKKKITYTVKQLFPYCILLEDKAWNQNLSKLYQTGSNDTWIRRGLNNSGGDNGRKRTDRK